MLLRCFADENQIEDGVVKTLHKEEGGGYTGASGADQMLKVRFVCGVGG